MAEEKTRDATPKKREDARKKGQVARSQDLSGVLVLLGAILLLRFFGGGMMIAPDADPADGLLDVVIIGDISKAAMARLSGRIYKGAHVTHPAVEVYRARSVRVESEDEALLDVDGEPLGRCPIDVKLLHRALKIWV